MQKEPIFYTVQFFAHKDGQDVTHVITGTEEDLQTFCENMRKSDSVQSCVAVYICSVNPFKTAPVIVKKKEEKKKEET